MSNQLSLRLLPGPLLACCGRVLMCRCDEVVVLRSTLGFEQPGCVTTLVLRFPLHRPA